MRISGSKQINFTYGSIINYSPKGDYAVAEKSRQVTYAIKAARPRIIANIIKAVRRKQSADLRDSLFGDKTLLVPVPSSSKLMSGGFWKTHEIAKGLLESGIGSGCETLIKRTRSIQKSHAHSGARQRNTVDDHIVSLGIDASIIMGNYDSITLIDDVITQGRTCVGCALKIQELNNSIPIRFFAVAATISDPSIVFDQLFNPFIGKVSYYVDSGKTFRHPSISKPFFPPEL